MNRTTLASPCPCCRMAAFARWPAGMGADGRTQQGSAGPAPSFLDETATKCSAHALAGDDNTRDLFEHLAADRWLVIRGATVLPMTKEERLADCDVFIRNGVIDAVQRSGAAIPQGARVIDAQDKFVIPGLSEMHTHPFLAHWVGMYAGAIAPGEDPDSFVLPYDLLMFLYLAAGITRIEIMAGTAEELALREAVRSGRIRGPAMRVASPVIDGFPAMNPTAFSWVVGDASGARHAAQAIIDQGFDFAKPYTRLSREALGALLGECDRLGVPVMGHIPQAVGAEEAIAMGQRGVAHVLEFFYRDPPEKKRDIDRLARYAKLARAHGVTVQTTLCLSQIAEYQWEQVRSDGRMRQLVDPLMSFVMRDESTFRKMMRSDPELMEPLRDAWELSKRMTQALVAEGVRLLPGTDLPWITQGLSLHEELRLFVDEIGIQPLDALRSATIHAAEYQGESGKAGQIAPGQRSDLVILDRDPLLDIRAVASIDTVMIGRYVLGREARESGIARVIKCYNAMPVPATAG